MPRQRRILACFALLIALAYPAVANDSPISTIGRGVAVVFSPDFSDPGNREFYESLGFLFTDTPDWAEVIATIRTHNEISAHPVRVVVVESHGTNGNGLKLQRSKNPYDDRSYISVGALQQMLESSGVDLVILTACNSGRLYRPEIYNRLDPENGDPLFLPATLGIYDASPGFDPKSSEVRVYRRAQSNLETLLHASTKELDPLVRQSIDGNEKEIEFAVSTILIQMLLGDPELELTDKGWVEVSSRADLPIEQSERLFTKFKRYLARRASETSGALTAALH